MGAYVVDAIRLQFQSLRFLTEFSANTSQRVFAYSSAPPPPALAFTPRKHFLSFKVTFFPFPYSLHSQQLELTYKIK